MKKQILPKQARKILAYDSRNVRLSPNTIISRKDLHLPRKIHVGDTVVERTFKHPKHTNLVLKVYELKRTGKPASKFANNRGAVWFGTVSKEAKKK